MGYEISILVCNVDCIEQSVVKIVNLKNFNPRMQCRLHPFVPNEYNDGTLISILVCNVDCIPDRKRVEVCCIDFNPRMQCRLHRQKQKNIDITYYILLQSTYTLRLQKQYYISVYIKII